MTGASAAMFRGEVWRELGFISRQGFFQGSLQAYFGPMDPNDLLTQAAKWRTSNVSTKHCGGILAALGSITAKTI